jgi:hypothetical protein
LATDWGILLPTPDWDDGTSRPRSTRCERRGRIRSNSVGLGLGRGDVLGEFYSFAAQASLTLLGLWLVVLRAWPSDWADDPDRRATGYHVSLYFMLPGFASALSLLSTEASFFWRAGFGLAAIVGAVENLAMLGRRIAPKRLVFLSVGLYALAGIVAAAPGLVTDLADDVTALHVEGVLLTAILFLGLNLAWLHLVRRDG